MIAMSSSKPADLGVLNESEILNTAIAFGLKTASLYRLKAAAAETAAAARAARFTSATASEAASPALKIPIPCPKTDGPRSFLRPTGRSGGDGSWVGRPFFYRIQPIERKSVEPTGELGGLVVAQRQRRRRRLLELETWATAVTIVTRTSLATMRPEMSLAALLARFLETLARTTMPAAVAVTRPTLVHER